MDKKKKTEICVEVLGVLKRHKLSLTQVAEIFETILESLHHMALWR